MPDSTMARAARMKTVVLVGLCLGLLLAAAHIGATRSERAHHALDQQYQRCVDRYGFGGEHFPECLRGER